MPNYLGIQSLLYTLVYSLEVFLYIEVDTSMQLEFQLHDIANSVHKEKVRKDFRYLLVQMVLKRYIFQSFYYINHTYI